MATSTYDELVAAFASGQALPIIGAGLSYAASGAETARWSGLLKDGLRQCKEDNPRLGDSWLEQQLSLLTAAFESGDLHDILGAASQIESRLGYPDNGGWRGWLRKTVGQIQATKDPKVLDSLRRLLRLRHERPFVCTTNYDSLLCNTLGVRPVTWEDEASAARLIQNEDGGVLHLHGHWEQPSSVVLGQKAYDSVVTHAHAQLMQKVLLVMRSPVFIGFGGGLKDANFSALLDWKKGAMAYDERKSFRLVLESELGRVQDEHPAEQRISRYLPRSTQLLRRARSQCRRP